MHTQPLCFIYTTAKSLDEMKNIVSVLLDEKLIACANISPGVKSFYRWENKVASADEATAILKTRDSLFSAVEARIRKLHSYSIPCVAKVQVSAVSEPFHASILSETLVSAP